MPNLRQSVLRAVLRCYPLYSGGIRIANHPATRWFGGTSDEMVWSQVSGGEVLACLNDLVGRTAFYTGDLDRKITWVCGRIVKPGDTVFDIGANIGIVSLWLSRLVGMTGSVRAFEPNPELYEILKATTVRNRVSNIHTYPVALGARAENLTLRIRGHNTGSGSLVVSESSVGCKTFSVQVETLDSIVAKERIERIRLLKVDVEGFEAEVFRGGLHVLECLRPQAVLFEFIEKRERRLIDQPVFELLQRAGYGFFSIPKCRLRMHLQHCDPEGENDPGITDFLAVQKNECFDQIAQAVRARH